jgi:hypothetical protein
VVVAEVMEIQVGLHLDPYLLCPHEPSEFQGHCQIGASLCPRAAISALLRLLDLLDIHNRDCGYLFYVEGFRQKDRVKKFKKEKG